jgi:hypothetical protein
VPSYFPITVFRFGCSFYTSLPCRDSPKDHFTSRPELSTALGLVLPATAFPPGLLKLVIDYYQPLVALVLCGQSLRLYDVFAREWAGHFSYAGEPQHMEPIPEYQMVAVSTAGSVIVTSYMSGEMVTEKKISGERNLCWLSKPQRLAVCFNERIELCDPNRDFECTHRFDVDDDVWSLTALKAGEWLAVRFGEALRIYAVTGGGVQRVHELRAKCCGTPMPLPGDTQMLTFNPNALALWRLPASASGPPAASASATASAAPNSDTLTLQRIWRGSGLRRPAVCAPGLTGHSASTLLLPVEDRTGALPFCALDCSGTAGATVTSYSELSANVPKCGVPCIDTSALPRIALQLPNPLPPDSYPNFRHLTRIDDRTFVAVFGISEGSSTMLSLVLLHVASERLSNSKDTSTTANSTAHILSRQPLNAGFWRGPTGKGGLRPWARIHSEMCLVQL